MKTECQHCGGALRVSRVTCEDCELSLEGDLGTPRLYRLSAEDQRFVELFVTASGSLKQMSSLLRVSYPTVRSRLDRLIKTLDDARAADDERRAGILADIDTGRISAKRGMRMLEDL